MTRVAANLSMLFTELPLLQRVGAAARAGFEAVEVQFPYEARAEDWQAELERHGMALVLHNLPAGNMAAGERGMACHPGREAEFRTGVQQALAYAKALGAPRLNCLCGMRPTGADEATLRRTLVANLRHAASVLGEAGIELLVEPLNRLDVPGFWLNTTAQALDLLDEVASPNLRIQYDIYHAQRGEGELAGTLERQLARIGHIQFADNPGRHEPGTGEINLPFLWRHLRRLGYAGDIGAEYKPRDRTEDGLGWLAEARAIFSA